MIKVILFCDENRVSLNSLKLQANIIALNHLSITFSQSTDRMSKSYICGTLMRERDKIKQK
jgi:hypothetical protein